MRDNSKIATWLAVLVAVVALAMLAASSAAAASDGAETGTMSGLQYRIEPVADGWIGKIWLPEDNAFALVDQAQGPSRDVVRLELAKYVQWYTGGDLNQPSVAALQLALDAGGVQYFTAPELLRIRHPEIAQSVGIETVWFDASPDVIARLVKIAKIADKLRIAYGGPIRVLNGVRPDKYNDLVSDATDSRHETGEALDLTADDMPRLRAEVKKLVALGDVRGAGYYLGNVHIDNREGDIVEWGDYGDS